MKKIIVSGSRNIKDYDLVAARLSHYVKYLVRGSFEVVSGGARGVDELATRWAKENGFMYREFPANWDEHGKKAGPIRNQQMADYAGQGALLIAFPEKGGTGTQDMIRKAITKRMNIITDWL